MSSSAALAPDTLRLLADDVRWQIVSILARSDMRVRELVDRVQRPQNLVSYHQKQLRERGVTRQSPCARPVTAHCRPRIPA